MLGLGGNFFGCPHESFTGTLLSLHDGNLYGERLCAAITLPRADTVAQRAH